MMKGFNFYMHNDVQKKKKKSWHSYIFSETCAKINTVNSEERLRQTLGGNQHPVNPFFNIIICYNLLKL